MANGVRVNAAGMSYAPASVGDISIDETAGTASASVIVDGATYTVSGLASSEQGHSYYRSLDIYDQGSDPVDVRDDGPSLAIALGKHSAVGVYADASQMVVTHGALDDSVVTKLPKQSAAYNGTWGLDISKADVLEGGNAHGAFSGEADFDSGTWAFALTGTGLTLKDVPNKYISVEDGLIVIGCQPLDNECSDEARLFHTPVTGTAHGHINGVDFNGSLSLTGGVNLSDATVDGRFYGPNAEELAGTIHKDRGDEKVIGTLMGHQ